RTPASRRREARRWQRREDGADPACRVNAIPARSDHSPGRVIQAGRPAVSPPVNALPAVPPALRGAVCVGVAMANGPKIRLNVAVIGSGISGLSAAWLLAQ